MEHRRVNWKNIIALLCCLGLMACASPLPESGLQGGGFQNGQGNGAQDVQEGISLDEVPDYAGEPYVPLEGNEPGFSEGELSEESFESYSDLDGLGRCGVAIASVGQDLMPTEKRGNISRVKPTGWQSVRYDFVEGKNLYNRCHLIGYQLSGENANERNLITGTRYMNVEGMLPFENEVAEYVEETGNHVMYRVTPVFEGEDLVASGVQMEAYSVEDQGKGVSYNVYVYNVQPGVAIDYATGESAVEGTDARTGQDGEGQEEGEIRGNARSKIYHCPGQAAYEEMGDSKNLVIFQTEEEAKAAGYRKAKR